jgi:hypothetical protein
VKQVHGLYTEGETIFAARQLENFCLIGQAVERSGERLLEESSEDLFRAFGTGQREFLGERKLDKSVKADDMIEVKVAQEKKNRIGIRQDPVQFREPVSSIEYDVAFSGGDKNGKSVTCLSVVPAVCA